MYLIWLSTIKDWNKLWTLVNKNENRLFFARKWKQNFINIINYIDKQLQWKIRKNSFFKRFRYLFKKTEIYKTEEVLKYFNLLKIKNSLVFYLTDKIEFELKDLKVLSIKNDLIFCIIFNSFENNLEWDWIIWINNFDYKIDLDNKEKISEYRKLRKQKILNLKQSIVKYWGKYISFDETKNIYKEFYKLFSI
jgi:hypothetical protein